MLPFPKRFPSRSKTLCPERYMLPTFPCSAGIQRAVRRRTLIHQLPTQGRELLPGGRRRHHRCRASHDVCHGYLIAHVHTSHRSPVFLTQDAPTVSLQSIANPSNMCPPPPVLHNVDASVCYTWIASRESSSICLPNPLLSYSLLTPPYRLKRFQSLSPNSKSVSSQRHKNDRREVDETNLSPPHATCMAMATTLCPRKV